MYMILLADDEAIERKVLKKRIKRQYGDKVKVYEASNGRDALELYHAHNIDIMILDIEMPGITGLECAKRVRMEDEHIAIIFLTAFDEFAYAKKAIDVHAMDYLLKPYRDEDLYAALDMAMKYSDMKIESTRTDEAYVKRLELANKENRREYRDSTEKIIYEYIENHYMEDLSVSDIADLLGYSESYFSKIFKQYFSKNFITFLNEFRMDQAKKQLRMDSICIKDIALSLGYKNQNYFTKVFKRVCGESPSEYRNRSIGEDS